MSNWRLIFCWESARWHGGVASIEQADGDHVIGCVWEIGKENLGELDIQEGVDQNIYRPIEGKGFIIYFVRDMESKKNFALGRHHIMLHKSRFLKP